MGDTMGVKYKTPKMKGLSRLTRGVPHPLFLLWFFNSFLSSHSLGKTQTPQNDTGPLAAINDKPVNHCQSEIQLKNAHLDLLVFGFWDAMALLEEKGRNN